ncbi:MAG TPA: FliA/WhiG family RNA polymerase sigma factor [Bryobacteraceae bacterium]|nr:FliA/WhiG family RNA polymerase sigma factor [Bryobacteraceae bacterium]
MSGYAVVASQQREALILEHLPQVRWIAGCIHERLPASVNEEDLVSAGVIGLINAIDNFDPTRNVTLRTYAEHRIRGAILDSIRGLDGVAPHKRKRLREVQEAIASLEHKLLRSPEEGEIAAELGVSLTEYQTSLEELRGVTLGSLDSVGSEGADVGLMHYLADETQEPISAFLERQELLTMLTEGVGAMPKLEQAVLDMYFHHELTLAEIGKVMDLHTSRISQLKTQAIVRLRTWLNKRLSGGKAARS